MTRSVNLIVTCTQRKKLDAVGDLRLGAIPALDIGQRAKAWRKNLERTAAPTVAASDLYAGDSWSVALKLVEAGRSRGLSPSVWVCSAGYGLVPLDAQLPGYAATFSPGHDDSVSSESNTAVRAQHCQEWWGAMTQWRGPQPGAPRSLSALAAQAPRTPMLFAGSEAYLGALQADLSEAAVKLRNRLVVISAGASPTGSIAEHQVPCDARFQGALGGARQSINVRILRSLLEQAPEGDIDLPSAAKILGKMSEGLAPLQKFDRAPMNDDEVRRFVRRALGSNAKSKHSPLLRQLREAGYRCEQGRFRDLFQQEAQQHGS